MNEPNLRISIKVKHISSWLKRAEWEREREKEREKEKKNYKTVMECDFFVVLLQYSCTYKGSDFTVMNEPVSQSVIWLKKRTIIRRERIIRSMINTECNARRWKKIFWQSRNKKELRRSWGTQFLNRFNFFTIHLSKRVSLSLYSCI